MDFKGGTSKNLELVACFYDKAIAVQPDGRISSYFGEVYGHPDSAAASKQTNLALITRRVETKTGEKRYSNSARFSQNQLNKIREGAGTNIAPLLNKAGERVGTIYGFKANIMPHKVFDSNDAEHNGKAVGFMPNTNTIRPSDLTVAPVNGKTITDRIFDSMAAARAEKAALQQTGELSAAPVYVNQASQAQPVQASQAQPVQAQYAAAPVYVNQVPQSEDPGMELS